MTARWLRRLFNLYPPYLGAGVRVRHLADDFRTARVEMPLRWSRVCGKVYVKEAAVGARSAPTT